METFLECVYLQHAEGRARSNRSFEMVAFGSSRKLNLHLKFNRQAIDCQEIRPIQNRLKLKDFFEHNTDVERKTPFLTGQ